MLSRREILSAGLTAGALSAFGLAVPAAGTAAGMGAAGMGLGTGQKFYLVDGWILTAGDVAALGLR